MPYDYAPVSDRHEPNIFHQGTYLHGMFLAIVSERRALSAPVIAAA